MCSALVFGIHGIATSEGVRVLSQGIARFFVIVADNTIKSVILIEPG